MRHRHRPARDPGLSVQPLSGPPCARSERRGRRRCSRSPSSPRLRRGTSSRWSAVTFATGPVACTGAPWFARTQRPSVWTRPKRFGNSSKSFPSHLMPQQPRPKQRHSRTGMAHQSSDAQLPSPASSGRPLLPSCSSDGTRCHTSAASRTPTVCRRHHRHHRKRARQSRLRPCPDPIPSAITLDHLRARRAQRGKPPQTQSAKRSAA